MSQVFEYSSNKLIACGFRDQHYTVIERDTGETRKISREKEDAPHDDEEDEQTLECTTDIKPLPGYDFHKFPYCLTRQKYCISLLDTKNEKLYRLIPDKKPEFDNEFMSIV